MLLENFLLKNIHCFSSLLFLLECYCFLKHCLKKGKIKNRIVDLIEGIHIFIPLVFEYVHNCCVGSMIHLCNVKISAFV